MVVALIAAAFLAWKMMRGAATDHAQNPSSGTNESSMILPYGKATLGLGETGAFSSISITPTEVVEDSRCPSKVQCIQAGTVRVRIASKVSTGASFESVVKLGDAPVTVGGFSVSLSATDPYPQTPGSIEKSAYRFTFQVHQSVDGTEGLEAKG